MITLQGLCDYLADYLHVSEFTDYCPNGLQVEGKGEIRKVATAVSANLETIEKAVENQVDALIVHHGLFWNRDPYPIIGVKRKKLDLLLKNEISLLAYHLPLDAHRTVGNNWRAAMDLGWRDLEPFCDVQGQMIGVKGAFDPIPVKEMLAHMESYYRHPAHTALGGKEQVASAALVSGGAYKSIQDAITEGVDCFITGNFDEPVWSEAHEGGIHFMALGHSATERIGPRALGQHLVDACGLKSGFLDVENPF